MGLFDRFRDAGAHRPVMSDSSGGLSDEQAIARYRYMLRTAPPETVEQAHAEAFAKLTAEQRRRVLQELSNELPEAERAVLARAADDPQQLARVATRAEIRQPGVLERVFGGMRMGPGAAPMGLGGLFAGTLLASMAGTVLGSMVAHQFFDAHPEASGIGEGASADTDTGLGGDVGHADLGDVDGGFGGGDTFDV